MLLRARCDRASVEAQGMQTWAQALARGEGEDVSQQEVMGQERVETYDLDVESYGSGSDDFGQNPRKWT